MLKSIHESYVPHGFPADEAPRRNTTSSGGFYFQFREDLGPGFPDHLSRFNYWRINSQIKSAMTATIISRITPICCTPFLSGSQCMIRLYKYIRLSPSCLSAFSKPFRYQAAVSAAIHFAAFYLTNFARPHKMIAYRIMFHRQKTFYFRRMPIPCPKSPSARLRKQMPQPCSLYTRLM